MKYSTNRWFTLTELIIAVAISALVLVVVFNFVADTITNLAETNKNTRFLSDFARYTSRIDAHTSTFSSGTILIDQAVEDGHDVLLFTDPQESSAVLWGVVDTNTYRLLPNTLALTYQDAVVWYRLISTDELASINANPTIVYDYDFFGDKTFQDFKVHTFQAEYFNNRDIVSIDMSVETTFDIEKVWILWSELPRDELFEVNLNF